MHFLRYTFVSTPLPYDIYIYIYIPGPYRTCLLRTYYKEIIIRNPKQVGSLGSRYIYIYNIYIYIYNHYTRNTTSTRTERFTGFGAWGLEGLYRVQDLGFSIRGLLLQALREYMYIGFASSLRSLGITPKSTRNPNLSSPNLYQDPEENMQNYIPSFTSIYIYTYYKTSTGLHTTNIRLYYCYSCIYTTTTILLLLLLLLLLLPLLLYYFYCSTTNTASTILLLYNCNSILLYIPV